MMKGLQQQDVFNLRAAQGWLDLGNPQEAASALHQISTPDHPDAIELNCRIYASAHQWHACLSAANHLTDIAPRKAIGWLYLAAAQHGLRRTADACETLLAVMDLFPEEPAIPYQLARYGSLLGWRREAQKWLDHAFALDATSRYRGAARKDPALRGFLEYAS